MAKEITQKQHLQNIRSKSHETMKKNGHYKKMCEKGREARLAGLKKYWAIRKANKK